MAIKRKKSGGDQEVVVTITVADDTAAGTASAVAGIDAGAKKMAGAGDKAGKAFKGVGDKTKQETDKAKSGLDRLSEAAVAFSGGIGKVPSALASVASGLVKLAPAVGAVVGLLTAGVAVVDAWATSSLAAQKASMTLMVGISGARESFGGLVSDMELARLGNKAFALGVIKNGAEFAELAAGVNVIAAQLGEDATQLMDNAVTAVGRGSALILDNLGIILNQAKAEEIYAKHLGITTKALTAYQKSQAFGKAAFLEIAKAGKEARGSIDGLSLAWAQGKVQVDNLARGALGFDETIGNARDAIRGLSDADLRLFGDMKYHGQSVTELTALLKEQGVSLNDVKLAAAKYGLSLEQLGEAELRAREQTRKLEAEKEKQAIQDETVKTLGLESDELEHQAALLALQKGREGEILMLQVQAAEKRKAAAEAVNDTNAALIEQRKIEILLATPLTKKSGGGSGPTDADRLRAADEAYTQELADQVKLLDARSELRGTELADAAELARLRLDSASAELELERNVLEITRSKNSVERQQKANRLAQIAREEELLSLQYEVEARKEANKLVEDAVALSTELADQERRAAENVVSLSLFRIDRERQGIEHAAALSLAVAKTEREQNGIKARLAADLHALRLRQLDEEHRASLAVSKDSEGAARAQGADTPLARAQRDDAIKQVLHDREVERQQYELQVARAKDAEEARLAEAARARKAQQLADVESGISSFQQLYGQASEFASFLVSRNAEAQDAELERTVASLNARGQAQRAAVEREVAAAKGNVGLQNEIRRRGAKQEQALQSKIEKAQADHLEKQRKAEARSAGFKLLIDAAVNAAQAVTAFASYRYVQGALLTAAAVFNGVQGAMLLAGNIPGAGSGGAGAGAGGSGAGAGSFERDTSAAASTPGSQPGEAARRSTSAVGAATQGQGGSSVVINGGVHVLGALDDTTAEKLAHAVHNVSKSREVAA